MAYVIALSCIGAKTPRVLRFVPWTASIRPKMKQVLTTAEMLYIDPGSRYRLHLLHG